MTKKWYFGTLIAVLALLVAMQQETVVPNQEIVLEFANTKITSPEAQNAISIVKKQLHTIGVKNVRISKELKDGTLKITYYSDADVASIKKILSKKQNSALEHLVLDQNQKKDKLPPVNNDFEAYNLDVHELQKNTGFDTGFTGQYPLEIKQKQQRSTGFSHSFISRIDTDELNELIRVAQRIHTNIAIAIDNTSHNIPEVRAGPIS